MYGPKILVRTMSRSLPKGSKRHFWQYHSRSDHHSKVACWGVIFDLLQRCPLLVAHVKERKVGFGVNHRMFDFRNNRDKNLDLVICTPGQGRLPGRYRNLVEMAAELQLNLTSSERSRLERLPDIPIVPVGSVLIALEAKACMTEHSKAIPRLHDELNSSHLIVHGSSDDAIAGGLVMINLADRFVSPGKNRDGVLPPLNWNFHRQPDAAEAVVRAISEIPRRTRLGDTGYDAMSIIVVECLNDGSSPVRLVADAPAPPPDTPFAYGSFIERLGHLYASRFRHR